jgi:DNA-3-methyladenine glycosylase II
MQSFKLTPKGPFSLQRAAEVMGNFPPLGHQPKLGSATEVRLGFVLDGDHKSVAVSLRSVGRELHGTALGTKRVDAVAKQVARIFSLDHDATTYPEIGKRDPKIGAVMRELDGLRPVCFTSPYECACWAVISQRITKTQASRVVAELVRAHGERVKLPGEAPMAVFPRPDRLLDVRTISGIAPVKVERLHAIATAALEGKLDAETIRARGDVEGPKSLLVLPGIGPFWASGIYLRACGIADFFPDEPLAIAALGNLHGLGDRPSEAAVAKLVDRYRPFRMWICFLLRVAVARGVLTNRSLGPRPGLRAALPRSRAPRADENQA